jgi:hypothetical protein
LVSVLLLLLGLNGCMLLHLCNCLLHAGGDCCCSAAAAAVELLLLVCLRLRS